MIIEGSASEETSNTVFLQDRMNGKAGKPQDRQFFFKLFREDLVDIPSAGFTQFLQLVVIFNGLAKKSMAKSNVDVFAEPLNEIPSFAETCSTLERQVS
jgi:hypothetical protein